MNLSRVVTYYISLYKHSQNNKVTEMEDRPGGMWRSVQGAGSVTVRGSMRGASVVTEVIDILSAVVVM